MPLIILNFNDTFIHLKFKIALPVRLSGSDQYLK